MTNSLHLVWCDECIGIYKQGVDADGNEVDEHDFNVEHELKFTGWVEW